MTPISLAALVLVLCWSNFVGAQSIPAEFKIVTFKQGLVSFAAGEPSIYEEGDSFPYVVNGVCMANKQEFPCLWQGFEITYESPDPVSTLECTAESNRPMRGAKPDFIVAESATVVPWGFSLRGYRGKYIRPQYTILGSGPKPLSEVMTCYFKGRQVLQYKRNVFKSGTVPGDTSEVSEPTK